MLLDWWMYDWWYWLSELPVIFDLSRIIIAFASLFVAMTASILFWRAIECAVIYVAATVADHPAFWT
jgi:hypothetical protein